MSEPSMFIVSPKKAGRPRVAEPRTSVCTWIAASEHDRLIALAKERDVSLSAFVRIVLLKEVAGR